MDSRQTQETYYATKLGSEIERVAAEMEQAASTIRLTRLKVDNVLGQPHRYGSGYRGVAAEVQRDMAELATRLSQEVDTLNRLAGEADSYRASKE